MTQEQREELHTSTTAQPEIDIEVTDSGRVTMTPHPIQEDEGPNPHTRRQLFGATIAGGLAGLLCGGPIVGTVAAGTAALAVSSKSKSGEVARKSGEAVAKIGDRLKEFDRKHHIVEKTKENAIEGFEWAKKRVAPRDAKRPSNSSRASPASE